MSQTTSSNPNRNKSKLPWYLAAVRDSLFNPIRELTPEELRQHKTATPVYVEARERLSLFSALQQNYTEWREFLNQLLNVEFVEGERGASLELNRLLINYLNCAHMIKDHFDVSFNRRFRKDPTNAHAHRQYIDTLCDKCFAFGFMLDFRNYCQHQGTGIRRYVRT